MKYFGLAVSADHLHKWRAPALHPKDFEELITRWIEGRRHSFSEMGIDNVVATILDDASTLRDPYLKAMNMWAQHYGKNRWGEKTPHNLFYVDVIAEMFPDAKFIFLVRDPRAVVRSMNNSPFFSDNCVVNAHNWRTSISTGTHLLDKSVPEKQRILVHYEDLVNNTPLVLKRIVGFLDELYEPQMVTFHEIDRELLPKYVRTTNILKPVDPSTASKWKYEMTSNQIAIVDYICKQSMLKIGYNVYNNYSTTGDELYRYIYSIYWYYKKWSSGNHRAYTMKHEPLARVKDMLHKFL